MLSLYLSLLLFLNPVTQEIDLQTIKQETFEETNNYRLKQGRDTLHNDPYLDKLAQEHSENMANGNVGFGHAGFDKRGKMAQKELGIVAVAENVYMSQEAASGKEAVDAWINSKGHRDNMKNKSYKRIGIGVAISKDGEYYFTQIFTD